MLNAKDQIFFSCNGKVVSPYDGVVFQAIQSLSLYPVTYGGATRKIKASNLDTEIRDGFYQSKVAFILFDKEFEGIDPSNLWVINEIEPAISLGIKCFVYHTPDVSVAKLEGLKLPTPFVEIQSSGDLVSNIKKKLSSLLANNIQ